MATLGVVAFRNGSPHGKLHVLQESINNLANTKTGKSDKRDICIIRKKQKLSNSPQAISVTSIINEQNNILMQTQQSTAQKAKKQQKVKDSITRIHNPPPIAVARRNARERNRVKQVNNGFATLRQHIPNEIAEIYENANNNRAANKKLSKVETLRMAVEYIRSLENILSLDENGDCRDTSNLSLSSFPSPASSESLQNSSSFEQSYFSLQSPMDDEEDSNPPTPLPPVSSHRYSRIPGTNAFQLIPGPATLNYEDEENIHPLTPNSDLISQEDMMIPANIISANLDYVQGLNQEFTVIHPQMLSPNFYSENSLSPNQNVDILDVKYAPQMNTISGHQIIYQPPFIFNPNTTVPLMMSSDVDRLGHVAKTSHDQMLDDKIVYRSDLKREPDDLDPSAQQDVEVDNMDEVINWWQVDGNQGNHS